MPKTFKELLLYKLNDVQGYHLVPFFGAIFLIAFMGIIIFESHHTKKMYFECINSANSIPVEKCDRILGD